MQIRAGQTGLFPYRGKQRASVPALLGSCTYSASHHFGCSLLIFLFSVFGYWPSIDFFFFFFVFNSFRHMFAHFPIKFVIYKKNGWLFHWIIDLPETSGHQLIISPVCGWEIAKLANNKTLSAAMCLCGCPCWTWYNIQTLCS